MEIFKKFTFDAAHYLPNVPEGHKCRNMHGHTYHLTVFVSGNPDPFYGWLIDFNILKQKMAEILKAVDHQVLNEVKGLENPTCELFARWLWDKIKPEISGLSKIELNETPTSGVIYTG